MALTKQGEFTDKVTNLPDVPSPTYTATQIKNTIQQPSEDLKTTLNKVVDDLTANTGATQVGAKKSDGTTTTVQGAIDEKATNTRVGNAETRLTNNEDNITNLQTNKLDVTGDLKGTWQGYTPSKADPGISSVVEQHTSQLAEIENITGIDMQEFPIQVPETDDTARIQRAVTQAKQTGKKVIKFPIGTFTFSQIYIDDEISLVGMGKGLTNFVANDNTKDGILLVGTQVYPLKGVKLKDFTLTLNSGVPTGIKCQYVALFSTFEDIEVTGNGVGGTTAGILLDINSYSNMFNKVWTHDLAGWGIKVAGFSPDNKFYLCISANNGQGGYIVQGNSEVPYQGGTPVVSEISNTMFHNCVSQNHPIAYYVGEYTTNTIFIGCHSEKISDVLLRVKGTGTDYASGIARGVTVISNNLYAQGDGTTTPMTTGLIDLDYCSDVVLLNNYMKRKTASDPLIIIGSNAKRTTLFPNYEEFISAQNMIQDNSSDSIYMYSVNGKMKFNGNISSSSGTPDTQTTESAIYHQHRDVGGVTTGSEGRFLVGFGTDSNAKVGGMAVKKDAVYGNKIATYLIASKNNTSSDVVEAGGAFSDGNFGAMSSAWNGSHMRLGNYHLWVDVNGKLRIKNSSPTSDTDGVTVGSQV